MGDCAGHHGRSARISAFGVAGLLALLLAGCASTSALPGHRASAHAGLTSRVGPPADPAKVAVVRHWAAALRAGNLRGAAGYFHLPSLFDDGVTDTFAIRTQAQAEVANATLTCGAQVISAFRAGRFIDVLFRLTARAGHGGGRAACGSGIGQTARTEFLIHGGQILEWLRAPSLPGDPGVPRGPAHPKGGGGSGSGQGGALPA